jgi:tRNA U34 5-carboxymethylaminomethyl modifying GTPase MnmE/TrmE
LGLQDVGEVITAAENFADVSVTGLLLENALEALYELSGKNVSDTAIDEVFKRFCVGK